MKHKMLIILIGLIANVSLQAQVLIKHDCEKINFDNDKLLKIVFEEYGAYNGDGIGFVSQSGDTLTFDIDEIYVLGFAADFTDVEQVLQSGKITILYDAANATLHVVNATEKGVINIYDANGKNVKSGKGNTMSIGELPPALYVVSYNKVLNVKVMKR